LLLNGLVLSFVLPKESTAKKSAVAGGKAAYASPFTGRKARTPRSPEGSLVRQRAFCCPAHGMRDGAFPMRPTLFHE